jgi:hypothetical protein
MTLFFPWLTLIQRLPTAKKELESSGSYKTCLKRNGEEEKRRANHSEPSSKPVVEHD